VHPRVFTRVAGELPGSMRLTWLVSLIAITLLFVTLCKLELTSKSASDQLRRLRRQLEAREEDEAATGRRIAVGAG
jgi:heme exporter protein C